MSSNRYGEMLEKYRDVDEDAIMSELSKDELAQLENEIDREILEKPPDIEEDDSDVYTTTSTDESSESEEEQCDENPEESDRLQKAETRESPVSVNETATKGKPEAFARGKLDRSQLKPVPQAPKKNAGRHTFKIPALKKTASGKTDGNNASPDTKGAELKNELIQAVSKRNKKRTKRANSGYGLQRRLSGLGLKPRRNPKIVRYRDGNERQVDAAIVNRNLITDEMKNLRPRLRKVEVKEPKLVLPEELHGVSFKRITAGAKKLQEEEDTEAVNSEDGDASRNSAYDADIEITPSLSEESYALQGEEGENEEEKERYKTLSECSEAPSDSHMTMASTASTSAESCDVFGEMSINPNSVEEMVERVSENDPMLTEVNLNNIQNVPIERFEELAEAMEENTHVTSLLLANTGLTDRAARAMAAMLKKNKKLNILNLESNFITGEGALRLVSALRKNNNLIELLLDNQRHIFGAKVEFEIAKMLKENKSILKFGYQFANPGPRMTTSNILTKNMDIVRKKRVAEEKKRMHAGQPKRPVLRRQPSSEWYRKERLQKVQNLQKHAKLLGLDPSGKIGEAEVEKVLQNMNPEEVSLLERWFTSKLLGQIDKPPQEKSSQDIDSSQQNSSIQEDQTRGREEKKSNKDHLPIDKNNLLRPPSRSPRSKSPVDHRGDLMKSIRNQSTKLKKVQVRPPDSPGRITNTDSDSSDAKPVLSSQAKTGASEPPQTQKTIPPSPVDDKTKRMAPESPLQATSIETTPTILQTAASVDEGTIPNSETNNSSNDNLEQNVQSPYQVDDAKSVSSTHEDTEERTEDHSPPSPSSSDVREWKEGEEYDSDEYEIVEVEVTDSEDDEENGEEVPENSSATESAVPEGETLPSPKIQSPLVRNSSPYDRSVVSTSPKYKSNFNERTAETRPASFTKSTSDRQDPNPYAAVLQRQSPSPKAEVYGYIDSKRRNQSGASSPRSNPLSPSSSRSSPRSPLSPRTQRSPLAHRTPQRLGVPTYNRSLSSSSSGSTDSKPGNSRYSVRSPAASTRKGVSTVDEEMNICPKALSTIESFFSFK